MNMADILLQHGETAVHMAASGGHVDVLHFLKEKGVDITLKDKVCTHFFFTAFQQISILL